MKKFIKYTIVFAIISIVITYFGLSFLDNYVYSLTKISYLDTSNEDSAIGTKIKLEEGIESLQYTYNNKYYSYLKDSKIYINNISNNENHDIIDEEADICYYKVLYDKNLILYITAEEYTSTKTKLDVRTYDMDRKRKNDYDVTFYVNNFSKVKDINYSPIVNYTYLNIETKTMNSTNNTIYSIDLFNNLVKVRSNVIIDNMIMLQMKNIVYYQNDKNDISTTYSYNSLFKSDVEMIGIDEEDYIYFLNKETNAEVYVVKGSNRNIVDTIKLTDTDIVKTYTNNVGVYLVYPTYVVNVASDTPYEMIGRLSKYVEFEAIKDDVMYLRTKDNILVTTKVKTEQKETAKSQNTKAE